MCGGTGNGLKYLDSAELLDNQKGSEIHNSADSVDDTNAAYVGEAFQRLKLLSFGPSHLSSLILNMDEWLPHLPFPLTPTPTMLQAIGNLPRSP